MRRTRPKVEDHLDLCYRVARSFHGKRPYAAHDWHEYIGAAYEGLVKAAQRWDPKRTGEFKRYATAIMWRRIIDYLRVCGSYTRNQKKHGVRFTSYSAAVFGDAAIYLERVAGSPSAAKCAETNDSTERLWRDVCRVLPQKWATVIVLYYRHGLTLREVGLCMGFTESYASQIRKKALPKLRLLLEAV